MNKYTFSLFAFCAGTCLFFSQATKAQIFFNNGAQVYATTGAIVQINGGLQDDNIVAGPGVIDNEGDITVTSNGAWPGNIDITNNAFLQGNGKYHLEQDWINDANFVHGTSMVEMYGSKAEYITSTKGIITTFDTLKLTDRLALAPYGSLNARKIQTLDAIDTGALILNDRTLWTQNHTMFIINPATACVTNNPTKGSEGFVQSESVGRLSRMTNSAANYFYPVGSDSNGGLPRYRPVHITPAAAAANTYAVRMADVDATNEGDSIGLVDTVICKVNPLFYHQIDRTMGATNADIDIYYDVVRDGAWTGIAEWNTVKPLVWNDMGVVTATAGPYNDNLKKNWSTFSPNPFILDNTKPSAPTLNCGSLCAGSDGSFTVNGAGTSYTWTTPAGTTILSGQGTDSINVAWGNNPGTITVVANSIGGCLSKPASCNVAVNPAPNAGYDTVSSGMFHNDWGFTDTTTNGTTWNWTFGDGTSSNSKDPVHSYPGAGTYVVTEIVTNSFGCTSKKIDTVIVTEGFTFPNVFTPNGDGKNDVLTITCSGTSSFDLHIYNRWGQEMFSTTNPNISWDGRTNAGIKVSDGTYYYVLKATSLSGKDWSGKGFITVLGSTSGQ
jgi:gliding motility-associated-like protein